MGLGTSSFFSYLNTMRGFACRFRLRSVFQPSETIRCAMFSIARFALPRKRLGRSTHTFRERKLVPGRGVLCCCWCLHRSRLGRMYVAVITVSRPSRSNKLLFVVPVAHLMKVLDEPAANQSDATVLELQLRAISKKQHGDVAVRWVKNRSRAWSCLRKETPPLSISSSCRRSLVGFKALYHVPQAALIT